MGRTMLRDFFYKICSVIEKSEQSTRLGIVFDPDHPIYQGHFPENPVTPGVCLIEMVKEVVSDQLNEEIMLVEAGQIKFLNPLIPDRKAVLEMAVEMNKVRSSGVKVKAQISDENQVYFKFSGLFQVLPRGGFLKVGRPL